MSCSFLRGNSAAIFKMKFSTSVCNCSRLWSTLSSGKDWLIPTMAAENSAYLLVIYKFMIVETVYIDKKPLLSNNPPPLNYLSLADWLWFRIHRENYTFDFSSDKHKMCQLFIIMYIWFAKENKLMVFFPNSTTLFVPTLSIIIMKKGR